MWIIESYQLDWYILNNEVIMRTFAHCDPKPEVKPCKVYSVIQTKRYPIGDEIETIATYKREKQAREHCETLRKDTWQTWISYTVTAA